MKKSQLKALIKEVIKTMMTEQYQATIKDPETGEEMDVSVEYDYHHGHMGRRVGMARFAEPDEPAQVEIQSIRTVDGRNIDPSELDQNTLMNLEAEIQDQHGEMQEQKEKPEYGDQLRAAFKKASKEGNVEAMAYYATMGPTSASVSFERFKGSWAYGEWLKKPETQKVIQKIQDEMKRFSYMR